MIVISRRRNERVVCSHQGVDLIVNVCQSFAGVARLGFIGPHRVLREELVNRQAPPITHLAGPRVVVGTYHIQRCVMCGAILQDFDTEFEPPQIALTPWRFYKFIGGQILDDRAVQSLTFESDLFLPPTCCLIGTQA